MSRFTDDVFLTGSRTNRRPQQNRGGVVVTALAVLLVTATVAQSQSVEKMKATAKMQATVSQAQDLEQEVLVPFGGSTVVDINVPLVRATVARPDVAAVQIDSPRKIIVSGNQTGSTVLVLTAENDMQLMMHVVVEPPEVAQVRDAINELAGEDEVDVRLIRDNLVLTGIMADVDTIEKAVNIAAIFAGEENVTNNLTLAGAQQVLLRCTVAEVSKSATRQLGVNGWMAGDWLHDFFGMNNLDSINPSNIGMSPTNNILQQGGNTFGTISSSPAIPVVPTPLGPELSVGFPGIQMQLFIRALRKNALLRVLANPELVALNGKEATFLAGGEFPVPIPAGLGTTTVEWRQFGVRLRFLPTVIGRNMIRLEVTPEVSEKDFTTGVSLEGGTTVPGLTARTATTTVELPSGSTMAIGGMLSEQLRGVSSKVPGLGDVPVLGALFSSVDFETRRTELVILVTPELVTHLQPNQIPVVPGEFMTEPNDWQLFGLGMLEGEPTENEGDADSNMTTKTPVRYKRYSSPPEQMTLHGPWGSAEANECVR